MSGEILIRTVCREKVIGYLPLLYHHNRFPRMTELRHLTG
jgi:hypothetical protein